MKIETKYIAEDGTIFSNKMECAEYEIKIKTKNMESDVVFYDSEGEIIPIEKIKSCFNEVKIICCKTAEIAEICHSILCKNYSTPWDYCDPQAGIWEWNKCNGEYSWVNISALINNIKNLKKNAPEWVKEKLK